jgi:hypothetical protein
MIMGPFQARGGLTYVDRLDFTRGDTLTVTKRRLWPSVRLSLTDDTLTLSSRSGSDTLHRSDVTALPHQPFYGRFPIPPLAVSFEVEGRDQVLLFWTPRVGSVIRELGHRGWDAIEPGP